MKIEYGPPGAVGVTHLQYLSADEPGAPVGPTLAFVLGAALGAAVAWFWKRRRR